MSATVLVTTLVLAACAGTSPPLSGRANRAALLQGKHGVISSNVTAADYAGSASCTPCHSDIAASFVASPMHRMTRLVDTAEVHAPFAGETLRFKEDVATLERSGTARFLRLTNAGEAPKFYRITRVLGGRTREDFVGIRVNREDGATLAEGDFAHRDEVVLPVSYLIGQERLRYKGYSVLIHERPSLAPGPVWNRTCLLCHNTAPYLVSLLGALAGPRAPSYQGEVVDTLLEGGHALRYAVTDPPALARAVASEVGRESGASLASDPGEGTAALLHRAIEATRDRLTGSGLLEVGIGCESCHGGCKEHVQDPAVTPSFEPIAPFLSVRKVLGGTSTSPTKAELVNHACARCHQVLFSRYPYTWEGGKRYAMPGGSEINSGEGRDFLLGACSGAMTCTACHDPHAKDERAHLEELATPAGNRVCLGCHAEFASPAALRAHAHHDPEGAGGACIACHMPKKNMSLDTGLTRYHRIGSPTDPIRVLADRPLECAVCHPSKQVGELARVMETWWNKSYDRDALRTLYGDTTSTPLLATLERGKPHEKAVALSVLSDASLASPTVSNPGDRAETPVHGGAEDRRRHLAPLFARELDDEYPLVREFARVALLRSLDEPSLARHPANGGGSGRGKASQEGPGASGGACELSMYAGQARLRADAEACLRAANLPLPTWRLAESQGFLPGSVPGSVQGSVPPSAPSSVPSSLPGSAPSPTGNSTGNPGDRAPRSSSEPFED
jgi:predicted CXXCH cytochrome family protein